MSVNDHRDIRASIDIADEQQSVTGGKCHPGFFNAITTSIEGAIEAPRGKSRNQLIALICLSFGSSKIFIASATNETCRKVASDLPVFGVGSRKVVKGGTWSSAARVTCGTFTSLDHSDSDDWDIIIYEDAFEALGKTNVSARGMFGRHRIFAFVDPHRERSAKDQLRLETLAGPVIYSTSSTKNPSRLTVNIALARYTSPSSRPVDDIRNRKIRLWNDSDRNQAIADVANGLSDGVDEVLWEHGLFLTESLSRPPRSEVSILVESIEHAQQLVKLLPGWTIIHSDTHAATNTQPAWVKPNAFGVPPKTIITSVAGAAQRYLHANVIVNACGGSWPQIPEAAGAAKINLLIIDFIDDGNRPSNQKPMTGSPPTENAAGLCMVFPFAALTPAPVEPSAASRAANNKHFAPISATTALLTKFHSPPTKEATCTTPPFGDGQH